MWAWNQPYMSLNSSWLRRVSERDLQWNRKVIYQIFSWNLCLCRKWAKLYFICISSGREEGRIHFLVWGVAFLPINSSFRIMIWKHLQSRTLSIGSSCQFNMNYWPFFDRIHRISFIVYVLLPTNFNSLFRQVIRNNI